MCVYSMTLDYWQKRWPQIPDRFGPLSPILRPAPQIFPTPKDEAKAIRKIKKLFDAAKEADKAMNEPDCEDPEKVKFETRLMQRLDELEKAIRGENPPAIDPVDDIALI